MPEWSQFASKVRLLDCTLRDGGYYNRWDFEPKLVTDYVEAMSRAKIDAVEIGFRNLSWSGFVGKLAYSQPRQLADLPRGVALGVMSDTKALLDKTGRLDRGLLSKLYSGNETATFVRLATLPRDLAQAAEASRVLAANGYRVFINLMQASGLSRSALQELAGAASKADIAALYLADSFGSLYPESTRQIVTDVREIFQLEVGFHAHDNLGLANANALAAAQAGATWIDGTMMGMGRGAGNARTENLVPVFRGLGREDLVPAALSRLVEEHFRPLQQRYEWGPSIAFGLAALAEIHPTYAQKLLAGGRYSSQEVLTAIAVLQGEPTRGSFSEAVLLKARAAANGWAKPAATAALPRFGDPSKPALVLGAGGSFSRYADGIAEVAANAGLVVLTNSVASINAGAPTVRTVIHRRHASAVAAGRDDWQIVHPFTDKEGSDLFPKNAAVSIPCELGTSASPGLPLRIPSDVVGMYAVELCRALGHKDILLAGFDGYSAIGTIDKDPEAMPKEALLTAEMNSYFAALRAESSGPKLRSITPTWYDLPVVSAYAPF